MQLIVYFVLLLWLGSLPPLALMVSVAVLVFLPLPYS